MIKFPAAIEATFTTLGVLIGISTSFLTTHLFGEWTPPLQQLFLLSVIDFGTGWGASAYEGKKNLGPGLSSSRGYRGVVKKVGIFALIAVGHLTDQALGQGPVLRNGVAYWFIAIELLSITENAGRMGLPVPPVLTAVIAVLKGRGGEAPATKEAA
ncbi:phage holin family protein [Deinococcus peraridilitoris]|uniref:Toxin secretion/phage lysis holin n=1 Tax=Deinococcus peraridilitoris (strain DSM 19664 / LMG 22246 / CIP 109416 / KR-200) TaxID=937777 RepID=K9ZWV1_DEIPD|nr:phage holin family protein [Deinococcus peraridilitoris]AFZ66056.1 toxin secretion/phage lysis holin [Deinococcus peraridilitoris DSM 19664]